MADEKDPVEVVNEKLRCVDALAHGDELTMRVRNDAFVPHKMRLSASECDELAAAFGAIAQKLREAGR